jgi:hypothetical protein
MTRRLLVTLLLLSCATGLPVLTVHAEGADGQPAAKQRACPRGIPLGPGYVPDARTAIRLAKSVLRDARTPYRRKRFKAFLKDRVWTVSVQAARRQTGGSAEIKIDQCDGGVLDVRHGK